jgi:hypothetical protein
VGAPDGTLVGGQFWNNGADSKAHSKHTGEKRECDVQEHCPLGLQDPRATLAFAPMSALLRRRTKPVDMPAPIVMCQKAIALAPVRHVPESGADTRTGSAGHC